jgi:hypothetical protein
MYDHITISDLQANTDDQSKAKGIPPQAEKVLENIMQFKSLVCTSSLQFFQLQQSVKWLFNTETGSKGNVLVSNITQWLASTTKPTGVPADPPPGS